MEKTPAAARDPFGCYLVLAVTVVLAHLSRFYSRVRFCKQSDNVCVPLLRSCVMRWLYLYALALRSTLRVYGRAVFAHAF